MNFFFVGGHALKIMKEKCDDLSRLNAGIENLFYVIILCLLIYILFANICQGLKMDVQKLQKAHQDVVQEKKCLECECL